jgi:hypothetical protein
MTSLLSRIESSRSVADVETSSRRSTVPNVTTSSVRPVVLRNDVEVEDPLNVVLVYIEAWHLDDGEPSRPRSFGESDLRLANRGGARISAAEIAVILERCRAIERALWAIAADASLAGPPKSVPGSRGCESWIC